MHWNFFLFHVQLLFFVAAISLGVACMSWRRRKAAGGIYLTLAMVALAEWAFAAALEAAAVDTPVKIFWSQVEYIGFVCMPVLNFLFVVAYTRSIHHIHWRIYLPLMVIPVIIVALAWTNDGHHLLWSGFSLGSREANVLIYHHGPAFYVNLVYIYFLFFLSGLILARELIWSSRPFRWQFGMMLVGCVIPAVSGALYTLGINPIPGLDWSPIGCAASGITYAWSLFRLNLLDLVPVARDQLVEQLEDGMLVLDQQGRLVDINPAARQFLGIDVQVGYSLEQVFPATVDLDALEASDRAVEFELAERAPRWVELRMAPIYGQPGELAGKLYLIRDITRRKEIELALQQANERLRIDLEEISVLKDHLREQAFRDALTGLYNRRYLEEGVKAVFSRAQRDAQPVSFLMLDIDHFKEINDQCGHQTGDHILQELGKLVLEKTRRVDFACRYGGDEFILVLQGASCENGVDRAEALRAAFEALPCISGCRLSIHPTFSVGVAAYPQHGQTAEALIAACDQALYLAKMRGRNQVAAWEQLPLEIY